MNVPPEILSAILSHHTKTELKKARLVCKAFDAAAVPHLFNEILIVARYAQMERARLLASRFRSFVKTLIFCSEFLKPDFYDQIHSNISSYDICSKLQEEQMELLIGGEFFGQLCNTLNALPNLHKVILRHMYGAHKLCSLEESYVDNLSRMSNPWPAEGFAGVKSLRSRSEVEYSIKQTGASSWRELLRALFISNNSQIRNIIIEGEGRGCGNLGLSMSALCMTPRQRFCAAKVLPNLTSLEMVLDTFVDCQGFEHDIFSERMVAQTLRTAINLKSLVIELWNARQGDKDIPTGFNIVLGGCKMTKLVSLELRRVDFTEAEMTTFLQDSRGLRRMLLHDITIIKGFWKSLLQKVKKSLPLESFEWSDLVGIVNELGEAGNDYEKHDPYTAIEQYLTGDGPDPFQQR